MIKTLVVTDFTRPSLEIQEIKQSDGSFVPGTTYWCAVDFAVPHSTPETVVGKYKRLELQLENNPSEIWEFSNVMVMLKPKEKSHRYVLTYKKVKRLCLS
jgi:hypothetical protein